MIHGVAFCSQLYNQVKNTPSTLSVDISLFFLELAENMALNRALADRKVAFCGRLRGTMSFALPSELTTRIL
jgi:hypothetical protein